MSKIGFMRGYPDQCLMTRQTKCGVVFIAIWVADSLPVRIEAAIEETTSDPRIEGFTLNVEGSLHGYLSCEIKVDKEKKKAWIHQPHFLDKMYKKFGDDVKKFQGYRTPRTLGQSILWDNNSKVDEDNR